MSLALTPTGFLCLEAASALRYLVDQARSDGFFAAQMIGIEARSASFYAAIGEDQLVPHVPTWQEERDRLWGQMVVRFQRCPHFDCLPVAHDLYTLSFLRGLGQGEQTFAEELHALYQQGGPHAPAA